MTWVSKRKLCSLVVQFEKLKKAVREAVEERNESFRGKLFQIREDSDVILVHQGDSDNGVLFQRLKTHVEINVPGQKEPYEVRPHLTLNQKCRFNMGANIGDKFKALSREQVVQFVLSPYLFPE